MDTILKLVRERMDVDSFSRIERKKEAYFNSVDNENVKKNLDVTTNTGKTVI